MKYKFITHSTNRPDKIEEFIMPDQWNKAQVVRALLEKENFYMKNLDCEQLDVCIIEQIPYSFYIYWKNDIDNVIKHEATVISTNDLITIEWNY